MECRTSKIIKILNDAKIVHRYLYDNLIYDYRTKRHLRDDYFMSQRVSELFMNLRVSKDISIPPCSSSFENGIYEVNIYESWQSHYKCEDPIYSFEFNIDYWRGQYKSMIREKRLNKILEK